MSTSPRRLGSDEACPHCGARGGVVPDGPGTHQCAMCGGPRIVVDPAIERPRGEKPLLMQAKAARMGRAAWAMGAGVATALTVVSTTAGAVAAGLLDMGAFGWSALTVLAVGPALVAAFGWRRSSALSGTARDALRAAEEHVAGELLASQAALVRPAELAQIMHVSEDRALELLAHGEVARELSAEAGPPVRRLRVEDGESDVHETAEHESSRTRR